MVLKQKYLQWICDLAKWLILLLEVVKLGDNLGWRIQALSGYMDLTKSGG